MGSTSANGIDTAISGAAAQEMNFPHVVSGSGGGGVYASEIAVYNMSSTDQTIRFTFTPEAGAGSVSVTKPLPANGGIFAVADELFSFRTFQNGWVRVTGSDRITGLVAYATAGGQGEGGGAAMVPRQTTPSSNLFFAHIADLPPWYTGIALLNTSSTNAEVEVYAMNPDGTLIAGAANVPTAKFTLNAGTKVAKLLSELLPQTQKRTSDGGFVFVRTTNNVPLYGIELFFSRNLLVFINVAASTLPQGITYTPPAP